MEIKCITLKRNLSLLKLFDLVQDDSIENLIDRILQALVKYEMVTTDYEMCGESLAYTFQETGVCIHAFTKLVFDVDDQLLEPIKIHLQGLHIWGKDNECPECGAGMFADGYEKICKNSNCREIIDISADVRAEQKYNVDIDFNHMCKLN